MSCSRRDFLKRTLGAVPLVSLGTAAPEFLCRAALAAGAEKGGETVLVVIQLSGGNDGLNTLAPFADDAYRRHRPTIALPAGQVCKIDDRLGFHPRMKGFARLYEQGLLSVAQGVGYARSPDDHGAAMRDWQTGRPHDANCQTGWLGRTLDHAGPPPNALAPALFVSHSSPPQAITAERTFVPALRSLDQATLRALPGVGPASGEGLARLAANPRADENPLLKSLRSNTAGALAAASRLEEVVRSDRGAAGYPDFQLAKMLHAVAQLIRADLGVRIFFTELGGDGFGGFDNHAGQLGNHCALLAQLSASVAAFADDLARDKLLDRVLLMTFSEFGRTLKENGRRGTDHGAAAPVFLVGGRLRGGLVGPHPNLERLEPNTGLTFHTDYRRVYAAALGPWLGLDPRPAVGEGFEPLELFES